MICDFVHGFLILGRVLQNALVLRRSVGKNLAPDDGTIQIANSFVCPKSRGGLIIVPAYWVGSVQNAQGLEMLVDGPGLFDQCAYLIHSSDIEGAGLCWNQQSVSDSQCRPETSGITPAHIDNGYFLHNARKRIFQKLTGDMKIRQHIEIYNLFKNRSSFKTYG